jgi:hypothetical protein
MLSPKIRLLLTILFFVAAVVAAFEQLDFYIVFAFIATASILLLGHFKHGPILKVLLCLRRGNIAQAETLLNAIKRPQWLSKRYQAYYHFALALVASHQQDIISASEHSEAALAYGLLHDKEVGILYYNQARVAYEQKAFEKAKLHLEALKTLEIKDLHLKQRVEELDKALLT